MTICTALFMSQHLFGLTILAWLNLKNVFRQGKSLLFPRANMLYLRSSKKYHFGFLVIGTVPFYAGSHFITSSWSSADGCLK